MSTHAKGRIKISRADKIALARTELEESTSNVLSMVRRNEFIGRPVTRFEESVRKNRDIACRQQLARAKRAIATIERAAK